MFFSSEHCEFTVFQAVLLPTHSAASATSRPTSDELKDRNTERTHINRREDDGGEEVTQIHVDRSEAEMETKEWESEQLTHFCPAVMRSEINANLFLLCFDNHTPTTLVCVHVCVCVCMCARVCARVRACVRACVRASCALRTLVEVGTQTDDKVSPHNFSH